MLDLDYIQPVFRPPSEARSLILQVANGCSWNKCTFCEMYKAPQKKFTLKSQDELDKELAAVHASGFPVRRVFLADGDAMALSTRRLTEILEAINRHLPNLNRIASYCLPRNVRHKTVEELSELRELGLSLLYVGCESGDNLVLEKVAKGETFTTQLESLQKMKAAGMKVSVMILNGLGGVKYSAQHADHSARLMNAAQPNYLSTLVLSFPFGMERVEAGYGDDFEPLGQMQLLKELAHMIAGLELEKTIFRSDHASNYLPLKGVLNADKDRLLASLYSAIHHPGSVPLRQEWQRGL